MKLNRTILTLLIVFNCMVLVGQIWPAGAPPFARWVNIFTLVADISFLMSLLRQSKES